MYTAKHFKFHLPKAHQITYADKLMNELTELVEKPLTINHKYRSWISETSQKIINAKLKLEG
jgi:xylose isomerase